MKTDFSRPQTEGDPRYPRIRVSHSDPYRDQFAPSYLDTFASAMEKAFLIALRRSAKEGGAA